VISPLANVFFFYSMLCFTASLTGDCPVWRAAAVQWSRVAGGGIEVTAVCDFGVAPMSQEEAQGFAAEMADGLLAPCTYPTVGAKQARAIHSCAHWSAHHYGSSGAGVHSYSAQLLGALLHLSYSSDHLPRRCPGRHIAQPSRRHFSERFERVDRSFCGGGQNGQVE